MSHGRALLLALTFVASFAATAPAQALPSAPSIGELRQAFEQGATTCVAEVSAALERIGAAERPGAINAVIETTGLKLGKLAQPVRVAVTGGTASPGIFEVLDLLGKDRTVARLDRALSTIAG